MSNYDEVMKIENDGDDSSSSILLSPLPAPNFRADPENGPTTAK